MQRPAAGQGAEQKRLLWNVQPYREHKHGALSSQRLSDHSRRMGRKTAGARGAEQTQRTVSSGDSRTVTHMNVKQV